MGRLSETDTNEGRLWPESPAEEYLTAYEHYLMGAAEKEPDLPDGLTAEELEYIADQADYMDFQADNNLWGVDEDVSRGMYKALQQIREVPGSSGPND